MQIDFRDLFPNEDEFIQDLLVGNPNLDIWRGRQLWVRFCNDIFKEEMKKVAQENPDHFEIAKRGTGGRVFIGDLSIKSVGTTKATIETKDWYGDNNFHLTMWYPLFKTLRFDFDSKLVIINERTAISYANSDS